MATLTHVFTWSENGWKPITAKEAAYLHPEGTVSAHSGLFMCDLCGQYVLLTAEGGNTRHFRHSSYEKSKDCPERSSSVSIYNSYSSKEHDLPIRITHIMPNSFMFELGLIRVPDNLLTENIKIHICASGNNNLSFVYSAERLNYGAITYVPVGDFPCEKYSLNVINAKNDIYDYWSRDIKGINSSGTLFEASTGKMLPYDSDVEIGKKYYFLCRRKNLHNLAHKGISVKKISTKFHPYNNYYLYAIVANSMNEDVAKFFLDYHYRLTEKPISIQPIWPPYIENSSLIKHNQDHIFLHIQGYTSPLKTFPITRAILLKELTDSKLYTVHCQNRQQLISTGRVKALKYTYIWKEPITDTHSGPRYLIADITGNEIEPGETFEIPKNGIIRVRSEYDGEIVIKENGFITEKIKIKSEKTIEVDDIIAGKSIFLYIGLDCVWNIIIAAPPQNKEDDALVNDIIHSKGNVISAPHSLKNIALYYRSNPKLYKWILSCIKSDKITDIAFKRLELAYLKKL